MDNVQTIYSRYFQKYLSEFKKFQIFHQDTFCTLDIIYKENPSQENIAEKALEFFKLEGISLIEIEEYIQENQNLFFKEIQKYDHPLINIENLDNHKINEFPFKVSFQLDHEEQAFKMNQLFKEFKILARQENKYISFYFGLFHSKQFDFSVLNTRRAYFFDELIFGR